MRVLQVVTDTDRRGAQVFAVALDGALVERGHTVRTVALAPGAHGGGLPVVAIGTRRLGRTTLSLLRDLSRRADVVVAHGSSTLPAAATALAGLRTPFVYRQVSDSLVWGGRPDRRFRVRVLLGRAARVVALGEAQADVLHDHFGVPRARLRVIPNGVPADRFPPADGAARADARRALGLPTDAPVVAVVAALSFEKGVDLAIDAVADLPGTWLLVAGDGPERPALEAQAARRLDGRAVFAGALDVPATAYAAADVVLVPSRTESMPATPIEAAFAHRPVVATRVGAVPSLVHDGETGRLVPPSDAGALAGAVADLLGRPDRAAALADAARAWCLEHVELDVVASAWEAVLDEVVA